jgi:hypothetical protein
MSIDALHLMNLEDLRYERLLTKNNMNDLKVRMRGTRTPERMKLEKAVKENRDYIETINARIARLERKERN